MSFDPQLVKKDFPILNQPDNPGLVYLDSTASSQKPQSVIDAMSTLYRTSYANVHRGIYQLSEKASEAYEKARATVARFIDADPAEVIFTRNATESINLVAYTWGNANLKAGDEIIITEMEHHANIVPWQQLALRTGAILKWWPVTADYRLDLADLSKLFSPKTKLVACTHMSNVLGTVNPVVEIIAAIRNFNKDIVILIDGAQSTPHLPVSMASLKPDFFAFSSHKMLGPSGMGVLYGRRELLEAMPPFLTGGDMISRVTFTEARWNELPYKFEAGTPHIAGAVGLAAAIEYLERLGMDAIAEHEHQLTEYGLRRLKEIPGLRLIGPATTDARGAIFSFMLPEVHPHDLASILDEQNIAIRAGHHCAQPLHQKLGLEATARASVYVYNTTDDIDALIVGIDKALKLFGV
ncbi:MAG: cysteine desulfurase [Candidatus Kerfeldbacteria bacterium]|nr:cysteine desulfurase [Candidatus Kerfeldbacteria bacterium]